MAIFKIQNKPTIIRIFISAFLLCFFYFVVLPCILILSRILFIQLSAQLDCSRKVLKLILKFTLKCSYVFRFNNHHQGSLLLCLAKVIIIKIYSKNVVMNQFGRVAAYLSSLNLCVCTV